MTNGNANAAKVGGLTDLIDLSLDATTAGAAKPDPKMLHQAMATAAVTDAALCVHVGDDRGSDVEAARAAGWRSIWIPRR